MMSLLENSSEKKAQKRHIKVHLMIQNESMGKVL